MYWLSTGAIGITAAPQDIARLTDPERYVNISSVSQAMHLLEEVKVNSTDTHPVIVTHDTTNMSFRVDQERIPDLENETLCSVISTCNSKCRTNVPFENGFLKTVGHASYP
eukprot:TRINITY_DN139150_c0_g1_i1.p1 TRINITY_DN139150_c0_g1~~TRINITY_DN139150_c0_g1_i1.p1  ORF type:complete len:111 (+),score=7.40 TRINITY_DN139150_c0_g1_i1:110-442(+)